MRSCLFQALKTTRFFCVALMLFSLMVSSVSQVYAAAPENREALKSAIKEVLKENPDIVLDLLRDQSETVLEIAQQGNQNRKKRLMLNQWKEDAKQPKVALVDGFPFRGVENAPVTVVAYSDYTCSFCRQAEVVLEQLLVRYEGKIKIVFKALPKEDVPLSMSSAKYGLAAFMQDEPKAWEFSKILFAEYDAMAAASDDTFFKDAATRAGLDFKRLKQDAASKKVSASIKADSAEADALNIQGTPYFLVNDLVVRGAIPLDMFSEAIDLALGLKGIK